MLKALAESSLGQYIKVEDDRVRFRDLTNPSVVLGAGEIPPCVLKDVQWGPATTHARGAGQAGRLSLHFILGPHNGADDLVYAVQEHGEILEHARAVGVETGWWRTTRPYETLDPERVVYAYSPWQEGKAYQQAQLRWLRERGIVPLPSERESGSKGVLSAALAGFGRIYHDATGNQQLREHDPQLRNAIRCVAFLLKNFYRGLGFVAQAGLWHSALEARTSPIVADARPFPFMNGGMHEPVADWCERLGVPFEVTRSVQTREPMNEGLKAFIPVHRDMVVNARATIGQLQIPLPF